MFLFNRKMSSPRTVSQVFMRLIELKEKYYCFNNMDSSVLQEFTHDAEKCLVRDVLIAEHNFYIGSPMYDPSNAELNIALLQPITQVTPYEMIMKNKKFPFTITWSKAAQTWTIALITMMYKYMVDASVWDAFSEFVSRMPLTKSDMNEIKTVISIIKNTTALNIKLLSTKNNHKDESSSHSVPLDPSHTNETHKFDGDRFNKHLTELKQYVLNSFTNVDNDKVNQLEETVRSLSDELEQLRKSDLDNKKNKLNDFFQQKRDRTETQLHIDEVDKIVKNLEKEIKQKEDIIVELQKTINGSTNKEEEFANDTNYYKILAESANSELDRYKELFATERKNTQVLSDEVAYLKLQLTENDKHIELIERTNKELKQQTVNLDKIHIIEMNDLRQKVTEMDAYNNNLVEINHTVAVAHEKTTNDFKQMKEQYDNLVKEYKKMEQDKQLVIEKNTKLVEAFSSTYNALSQIKD